MWTPGPSRLLCSFRRSWQKWPRPQAPACPFGWKLILGGGGNDQADGACARGREGQARQIWLVLGSQWKEGGFPLRWMAFPTEQESGALVVLQSRAACPGGFTVAQGVQLQRAKIKYGSRMGFSAGVRLWPGPLQQTLGGGGQGKSCSLTSCPSLHLPQLFPHLQPSPPLPTLHGAAGYMGLLM